MQTLRRALRATAISGSVVAAMVAASALVGVPQAGAQDNTIVFAGWGGDWQKAERTHFFQSFEKETGIRVIDVPDVNLAKIKAMVDTNNVEWDVVQALGMWVADEASADTLFERLEYSKINADGVPKEFLPPHGAAVATFAMVLAYNTNSFANKPHPTKWQDLWDFEKFPGKRGMINEPRYSLEIGLMGQGIPKGKLYPLDVEASLKHWAKNKDKILWWDQWPQSITLLASGELDMSLSSQGRVTSLLSKEPNAPVSMVWDGGIMTIDFLAIPKGSKRKENAQKLISWMLDPKRQAEYAKATGVGPSNIKALDLLDDKTKQIIPSYHYAKGELVAFDNAWWAKNRDEMTKRWNRWKLQ